MPATMPRNGVDGGTFEASIAIGGVKVAIFPCVFKACLISHITNGFMRYLRPSSSTMHHLCLEAELRHHHPQATKDTIGKTSQAPMQKYRIIVNTTGMSSVRPPDTITPHARMQLVDTVQAEASQAPPTAAFS
eukprot:TRINITY_DN111833_c0_g1_i1.p1 TRINITY_DN111833_c0_g1~~TRINITY_DN111833_c0_g1_i1.p1  ORF type:complete len:133 (-),score=23.13 TRINITY_DN111833_c0_g1_i1:375-773(-)